MSKEWDRENMKTLACRVRKDEAEAFRQYAESCGTSAHALLASYVRNAMASNDGGTRSLTAENRRLAADLAQTKADLKMLKDIAKQYEDRALRAEELIRKYILER